MADVLCIAYVPAIAEVLGIAQYHRTREHKTKLLCQKITLLIFPLVIIPILTFPKSHFQYLTTREFFSHQEYY